MTKKTDTNETADTFTFPPVRNRLLVAGRPDENHFMESGEPLYVVSREYIDLDRPREQFFTQTGIHPKNTDRSFYSPKAEIYSTSYGFLPGDLVTPGLLAGVRQCESDESRAWIETLIRSKAIVQVGRVEASGSWMNFVLTTAGADILFNTDGKIMSRVIRPLDPVSGYPVSQLPIGRIYMATGNLSLSASTSNTAAAGSLICEACLPGAASLIEQGRVIEAGKVVDTFSTVELIEPVKDLFRNLAIIEIDERLSGTPRTEEQKAAIDRAFNAAIEAAGGAK